MKMIFKLLLLTSLYYGLSPILSAQTVTVTGTITDTGTTPYSNGSLTITLVNSTGQQATFGGSPSFQTTYSASLDANGSFSISLPPNSTATPSIRPPGTQWNFSYQSQGGYGAANINVTITSSGSITGTLSGLTRITWPLGRTAPPGGVGQGIVVVSSTTLGWGAAGGGTGLSGPAFSIGTGSAQAQTVQPVTPITDATLATAVATTGGFEICWAPAASNTAAAPTLAGAGSSTFTAHAIFKGGGLFNLIANDILFGAISCAIWDGTAFELQNPLAGLAAANSLTLGGGASAVGSGATGGYGCGEATNTGFTPTVGLLYKRCDNVLKTFVSSLDGAAETPDPTFDAVPVGGKCLQSLGGAGHVVEAAGACGGNTVPVSGLTAATGPNTTANGNNPQTLNWAQTTDSQNGITFGETVAATGGTLTAGLANQGEVAISTAAGSTSTPYKVTQGTVTGVVPFPAAQWQTTWNNAGLTGQGLFFNVTDTASASGSMIATLQKNGVNIFQVRKDGRLLLNTPGGDTVISAATNSLRLGNEQSNNFVQINPGFAYNTKQTIASSATPAFNLSTGNVFSNTLTGNVTGATVNNLRDSQAEFFELCQDGTGGRSFVWPTNMKDPPLTHLDASVCKVYPFIYDGTSLFYIGGESTESNVTPVTVNANVATDQLLQAIPISSNTLNIVGHTLDIWTAGIYTTTAANTSTITVKAKLCTVSGCGSGTVITLATFTSTANAGGQTNDPFSMQLFSTTQTGGASSVFEAHGNLTVDLTAAVASQIFGDANTAVTSAIDTTGPLFLQITAAFSVASGSNSFTGRQLRARLN